MGLFSFVKDAGAKVFGRDDDNEKKQKAIEEHIAKYNMFEGKVSATVEGATVKLSGTVSSAKTKAKLMIAAGNIEGVESVENYITVAKPQADVAPVADSVPAPEINKTSVEVAEDESVVRYYDVKSGDTLSKIAGEMYGDVMQYPKIFEANKPMLTDPDLIYPGQKLVIPE